MNIILHISDNELSMRLEMLLPSAFPWGRTIIDEMVQRYLKQLFKSIIHEELKELVTQDLSLFSSPIDQTVLLFRLGLYITYDHYKKTLLSFQTFRR